METEVMFPSPAPEFNFDSACSSPFITAPSSPAFFSWEKQISENYSNFNHNFEFDFSGTLQRVSISDADDLFSEGRIKPLKPPPRVEFAALGSPRSPKSPAKIVLEALSPKKKEFDPFEEAIKQTQRENRKHPTRPGSPFRVVDILSEDQPMESKTEKNNIFSFSKSAWKRYKKWKIKDFLLFRSASEGRKDEITHRSTKNYPNFEEDIKSSSFRSAESSGSVSGSGSGSGTRRKGSVSAHEVHYTVNRAVQEEMKKKTPLPYKHGLMGCLGFEPPVHDLVRSFGSSRG